MTEKLLNDYALKERWDSLTPRDKLGQYFGWLRKYNTEFDFLKGHNLLGLWSPLGCGPFDDWPDMITLTATVNEMLQSGNGYSWPAPPVFVLRELKGFAERVSSDGYSKHAHVVYSAIGSLEKLMQD